MATAPLLSIGMIFKNEERCLERCLKSLEPLRKAIPCELVMADTGAEDGSREIAERYADEVFDFEWIDDFAAARNAVMDRCRGKWYFSVDCDEWLDADITELLAFLKEKKKTDFAFVMQRNYASLELEKSEQYSDFRALRIMRMSTGLRFRHAIHESWFYSGPAARLTHTVLHHDGYFLADPKANKNKRQRNMKLLRQKLEQQPEDLRTLNQCIESGTADADFIHYVRTAVNLVQKKSGAWMYYGPIIMSHAIEAARVREMPELEEWIAFAAEAFPDSIFTRVDVHHTAFMAAYDDKEWEKVIPHGEAYRKGLHAYRTAGPDSAIEYQMNVGCPYASNPEIGRNVLIGLANAYLQNGQGEKALETLKDLRGEELSPTQVRNAVVALSQLHAQTPLDVSSALTALYEQISEEKPNAKKQKARLAAFDSIAAAAFTESYQKEEQEKDGWHRPACTAFRVLADQCEAGRAAAIMMTSGPAGMRDWLLQVEDWQALPVEALEHALAAGVAFPLEEKPLNSEIMGGLAARLTHGGNMARQIVLGLSENEEYPNLQNLFWAQNLMMAALQSFDWTLGKNSAPVSEFYCPEKKKEEDERPADTPETGLVLIRRFAQIESATLPLLYAPQMLTEENAAMLPSLHRWGLYCAWALDALDASRPQEYLALLRKGVKACPGEKDMVQFLLDRFMEDAAPKTSPELLALAEKVRMILSAYDPDDPAVAAIRESAAYRQVAWIIEPQPVTQLLQ